MINYKTLILDKKTIHELITPKEAIKAVEYAFALMGKGRAEMPPKIYLHLDKYKGDFRAMPGYIKGINHCGIKWVNVHPQNPKKGLPTVMAVIILNDLKTGFPLCIMDGAYITQLRTGAAGAVAAKYLARKNSSRIGLAGCGIQARSQLLCLNEIFKIKEVKVWGHIQTSAKKFIKDMNFLPFKIKIAKNIQDCVKNADIIVTTTPVRKPLVKAKWVMPGTHINAIGADSKGKEELSPGILKRAKIVVDDWRQASHSGEINVPLSKGIISKKDIYGEIGEIVCGKKKGRKNNREITVFDSTGLAIQDISTADLIYKKALKDKKGTWINLV